VRKRIAISAGSLFLLAMSLCGHVTAAPQTGWWWNPAESGRGFFVESHDGATFIGAYFYDGDGHAKWLVAGGANADPYNYAGDLLDLSGGQTLYGAYVAPGAPNVAGQMSVHFADDTHGTLTWPGGNVAIERQIFGTGDPAFEAEAGWWWNADESGTGFSVEIQGQYLFVVGFMYEDGGRPVWYFTAGPMNDDATYHGDVLQLANGQTMGGPYKAPTSTKIGTVDIVFTEDDQATVTFTSTVSSGVTARKAGQSSQRSLTTQFTKNGGYVFPPSFYGSVGARVTGTVDQGDVRIVTDLQFSLLTSKFSHIETDRPDLYDVKESPGLVISASQTLTSAAAKCSATLPITIVPLDEIPHQQDFALLVNHHRGYNLTVFVPPGDFAYNLDGQCVSNIDGSTTPYFVPLSAVLPVGGNTGAIVRGNYFGAPVDVIKFDQNTTVTSGAITTVTNRFADLHSQTVP